MQWVLGQGKHVHDFVARNGLESNLFVANTLMDMYMLNVEIWVLQEWFLMTWTGRISSLGIPI